MMKRSISVIIPCLNEEENLDHTYENVVAALQGNADEFEIIIFDDGSTDGTGAVADLIKKKGGSSVLVVHNGRNRGFGYNFIAGLELARMEHVIVIPGDNEISRESMARIFRLLGRADMIIPFTVNMEIRPWSRRLISRLFTLVMNSIFCCELQYYNGPVLHRTALVRGLGIKTTGFAFGVIMLVKLIRQGYSFCEVDMYLQPKHTYRSSAVRIRNVLSVIDSILRLMWSVRRDPALNKSKSAVRINPHVD